DAHTIERAPVHQHADQREIIRRARTNAATTGKRLRCRRPLRRVPHRFGLQRPVGLAPMPTRLARPLRRRYDKAGVVHAEWFENVLPEMYIQWLAAHRLHDAADPIDVAAVLPALPGIEHQRRARELVSVGGWQLVEGLVVF